MKVVFLDSVGLIALWNKNDQWQKSAADAWTVIDVPGIRFVTSSYILVECGNAAVRKPYRSDVCNLRDQLIRDGDLILLTDADVESAWTAYRRGGAGIVDQISFIVMRRLNITDVFSNDQHFKTAGFNTLF